MTNQTKKTTTTKTATSLAQDVVKNQVSSKPVKAQKPVKLPAKAILVGFLNKIEKIDFRPSWEKSVLLAVSDGKASNQCLEILFLSESLKQSKIKLVDNDGKEVDLSKAVDYAKKKIAVGMANWTKWNGIHKQAFKAVFERMEGRDYPCSVIAVLNKNGYSFK